MINKLKHVLYQISTFTMLSWLFFLFPLFAHVESQQPIPKAQLFQLPLHFESNAGQADANVKYLARKQNCLFLFTPQEVIMALPKNDQNTPSSLLKLQFIGGHSTIIEGIDEQLSKTSYFIGNEPEKWHTDISNYGKIAYRDLYPGIDVLFYGHSQQLEYDVYIKPGADPKQVRLQIEGASSVIIDDNGSLQITAGDQQQILMHKPFAYQIEQGLKVAVPADFLLSDNHKISLIVGEYDTSKALVIDPVLSYSTYLGGTGNDNGYAITVDASGNAYVCGTTTSTNFPTTAGAFQTSLSGTQDIFITKLNSTGTALIYSTYLGGSASEFNPIGVGIDAGGNAYLTGSTTSTNFPVTPGAFQTVAPTTTNAFVTKINPTGTALIYSTYLGGSGVDGGFDIAIDDSGNAYVCGNTASLDFPTTAGAFQTTRTGINNAFVTQLNSTGTALIYSTYLGGSLQDTARGIKVDSSGNAYVCGTTSSTNFPTTPGAFQTVAPGGGNGFITKFNSTGTALIYSTYLGGSSGASTVDIDVSSNGNAYVTGATTSTNFPVTAGAFQTTKPGTSSAFITQLNSTGSALVYSTYLGGSGSSDQGMGIVVDSSGNASVIGSTQSSDFPTTTGAFQTTYRGNTDAFLTKINATGTNLIYSTYFGGTAGDQGRAIALDDSGNVYITGNTASTNFPITSGAFDTSYNGGGDAYVAKFTIGTPTITNLSPNFGPIAGGTMVTITGTNFTDVLSVTFGGVAATSFIVNSDTSITAVAPPGSSGTVDVVVTTLGGSSVPDTASQYTYIGPIPTITSLSPNSGPTTGGTAVNITGTNFTGTLSVTFGGVAATSFMVNSDTSITAIAPPGSVGIVDVVVTNVDGSSVPDANSQYTYTAVLPTITSLSPNSGPTTGGTAVNITGTNFTGTLSVTFGGVSATSFIVNSDTSITAVAPSGAVGTVNVVVTNADGSSVPDVNSQYTYTAALPTITNLSPNSGPTTGGTAVNITGTNFTGTLSVTFGGVPATSFIVNSDTSITAVAPSGAVGTVNVVVTNADGSSVPDVNSQYTYTAALPTITNLSPNSGPTTGGTAVSITGTNFTGTLSITFGGVPATSFIVNSDTSITAVAPSGALGTVNVIVTNAGGSSVPDVNSQYTYTSPAVLPTITTLSPNSGPDTGGTFVIITGANFTGTLSVTFGGVAATSFMVNSDTFITAVAPPGSAGTVDVVVTNASGSSVPDASSQYTYTSSAPLPPSKFVGVIKRNKCLTTTGCFLSATLRATWKPSPSPDVAFYKIKKNKRTVETIPATDPLVFKTKLKRHPTVNYSVIAVSTSGLKSTPVPLKLAK